MAAIALEGVGLVRSGVEILRDVDLEVAPGGRMCVLGGSGSGKTSLLRLIAGLEKPSRGTVAVEGRPAATRRSDVTMVFQDDSVYEHLDVRGNLAFPLVGTAGVDSVEHRVRGTAERFAIGGLLARRPETLSAGERRVVSTARALVRDGVRVVLLDEPALDMDPQLRRRLVDAVLADPETTVVFASRDPEDVMRWSRQVAVLTDRTVAQTGPPREVWRRSVSLQAAELLGELNRFPATVRDRRGRLGVGESVLSVEPIPERLAPGRRVVVGVRPGDLVPARPEVAFDRRLRGTIGRLRQVGRKQRVLFGIGAHATTAFCAEFESDDRLVVGESVDWHVDPAAVGVFDPGTGAAI